MRHRIPAPVSPPPTNPFIPPIPSPALLALAASLPLTLSLSISAAPRVFRSLDEIFAGEYEGYRYAEIKAKAAKEADLRSLDKLGYRYPRGESYLDIIQRLDPLIQEMEMYREPLLIVSHQANSVPCSHS